MAKPAQSSQQRRVYPLDAHRLTEEEIAVAFAMTSRRPEPFDEIAQQISQERAADFHERWVLGYGHASVAEHAVLHLAVENISRLACDTLEDNRLASYTEKSSRYQVFEPGSYHLPRELEPHPQLEQVFRKTCDHLFESYQRCIEGCLAHLRTVHPQGERERDSTYNLRLRRMATDSCRSVLPAATFTNVGVTANARVMEHAISKLLSSQLIEERDLGEELLQRGREITPTLIKYAAGNQYLTETATRQQELSHVLETGSATGSRVRLVYWDERAEEKLAAALIYRYSSLPYDRVVGVVREMGEVAKREIIADCLARLGDHDAPVREFELVDYTFEFDLDYGAYREFKRHRMQTYIPQPLTVLHGYSMPALLDEAGLKGEFDEAMDMTDKAFRQVSAELPNVAPYLVTHAHFRRVLAKMNLRECYHLFKLRTSPQAHESIRRPMGEALALVKKAHPALFRGIRLRE